MTFEVKNGFFAYSDNKKNPNQSVLSGISYKVEKGRILGILGPNGVGKTTLLRCSMGMLKWNQGQSLIDGVDLRDMSPQQQWRKMAYVPQAKGVAQQLTVWDMVLLGRSSHIKPWQQPSQKDKEIAAKAIQQVGISKLADKYCHQISGGELQMALIARALAGEPQMIVLDEPESNLDFKNQLIVLETLRNLSESEGISCIFNTHYPGHALEYCHDALVLDRSGSSLWGPVREVLTQDNLRRTFGVEVHVHDVTVNGKTYSEILPLSLLPENN